MNPGNISEHVARLQTARLVLRQVGDKAAVASRPDNISALVLRPTPHALANTAARAALAVLPGLLLIYAALTSRVITPAIFGTLAVGLGVLIFANQAMSRLRLESDVLIGRSLLGRISLPVSRITRIVPVNLSYRRTLLMPWKRRAMMFEVRTLDGPTGLWLNPNVYGEPPIQGLIQAMHIEPEEVVEERILDVFSTNRK